MRCTFVSLFFIFVVQFCFGQRIDAVPGSFLVQATESVSDFDVFKNDSQCRPFLIKKIAKNLPFYRLDFDVDRYSESEILAFLESQATFRLVQKNHRVEHRGAMQAQESAAHEALVPPVIPNDPLFQHQYYLKNTGQAGGLVGADLGLDQVWDKNTGGKNRIQDDIVVCVIDHGIDLYHSDLKDNLWKNTAEIPQNGLDDDENGYIDDVAGWNVFLENDDILGIGQQHGTQICGIIGAKGNNALGVTGINWKVKMQVVVAGQTEAQILEAYGYAYENRKLYNDTQGEKGAFVVATNASWGINFGQASDAPIWCALYDSLGSVGILNCAAAPNIPIDVDIKGDLPTSCPSDFLCTATSMDENDELTSSASWGLQHIDFGTYGKGIHSTLPGNFYGKGSGTSFAAPQLAAAVALLYSDSCADLTALSHNNPRAAALYAKFILMDGVKNVPSLSNKTASGGRLHIGQAMESLNDFCSDCAQPFLIVLDSSSFDAIQVSWTQLEQQAVEIEWRILGTLPWQSSTTTSVPFLLSSLDTCTAIEFRMRATCGGSWSLWTKEQVFYTKGCCVNPKEVVLDEKTEYSLSISWEEDLSAGAYDVKIKSEESNYEQVFEVIGNNLTINGLESCSSYEIQIRAQCFGTDSTGWSNIFTEKTLGCGTCSELAYCSVSAQTAYNEFIESIAINGQIFQVGQGKGYHFFSPDSLPILPFLFIEDLNSITLTPGFATGQFKEYFRVYLDINQDGDFNDTDELVYDPGFACYCPVEGQFYLPYPVGNNTRMRVIMRYEDQVGAVPEPCESFTYGQIVDFCVQMDLNVSPTHTHAESAELQLFPNPFSSSLYLENKESSNKNLRIWNAQGSLVFEQPTIQKGVEKIPLQRLPKGVYFVEWMNENAVFSRQLIKE